MKQNEIRQFIVVEILNDPSFTIEPDQDLLLTGILDSLSVVRLIDHIEVTTGRAVPPAEVTLENFGSLRRITGYVQSRVD